MMNEERSQSLLSQFDDDPFASLRNAEDSHNNFAKYNEQLAVANLTEAILHLDDDFNSNPKVAQKKRTKSKKSKKELSARKKNKLEAFKHAIKSEKIDIRSFIAEVYGDSTSSDSNNHGSNQGSNNSKSSSTKKKIPKEEEFLLWFLYARKWSVTAALARLKAFIPWRRSLGRITFDRVKNELETGKVLFLHYEHDFFQGKPKKATDIEKRSILYIRPRYHVPNRTEPSESLATIVFLLENALRSKKNLKRGITVLISTRGATMSNVDRKMPKIFSDALQNKFPIRLSSILVLEPPAFFRSVIWPLMKLFMKPKFIERVVILKTTDQLSTYVREKYWPEELGGSNAWDHRNWLKKLALEYGGTFSGHFWNNADSFAMTKQHQLSGKVIQMDPFDDL